MQRLEAANLPVLDELVGETTVEFPMLTEIVMEELPALIEQTRAPEPSASVVPARDEDCQRLAAMVADSLALRFEIPAR